ncbi:MAG TPA: PQQ-dependent sugar dehydrogenase [Fimbriimonadales bacterium]|nr:PQQ-dependent sugar dehydrogenase [Fimbriimonadales bacterium]
MFLLVFCLIFACNEQSQISYPPIRESNSYESKNGEERQIRYRVETVAENLEVPWSIAFSSNNRIIFTERPGRVRVIVNGKLRKEPLLTLPDVTPISEMGLMGLTLHPNYDKNHFVYLAYGYGRSAVRVVRYRDDGEKLVEPKVIIENIPAAANHAGCRIKFGPDGKLYITTGDATQRDLAQRLDSLAGKTLRINDDGSIPNDNPFVGQPGARPEIWSYGHRNSQGLDWQPGTNLMFQTEHGPSGFDGPGGGDEVNIVEKGKNYGWPLVSHNRTREGTVPPLLVYTPAQAPAGAMFYRGNVFPEYRGNFFFGCLRGQGIMRIVLEGRKVVSQYKMLENYGRIRDVAEGPDGFIYFCTSNRDGRGSPAPNDDRILRIVPDKQ